MLADSAADPSPLSAPEPTPGADSASAALLPPLRKPSGGGGSIMARLASPRKTPSNRLSPEEKPPEARLKQSWASTQSQDPAEVAAENQPLTPSKEVQHLSVPPRKGLDLDIALVYPGHYRIRATRSKPTWVEAVVPNSVKVSVAVSKLDGIAAPSLPSFFSEVERTQAGIDTLMGEAVVASKFTVRARKRIGLFEFSVGPADVPVRVSVHMQSRFFPVDVAVELLASTETRSSMTSWVGLHVDLSHQRAPASEDDHQLPIGVTLTKQRLGEIVSAFGHRMNLSFHAPSLKLSDIIKGSESESAAVAPPQASPNVLELSEVTVQRRHGPNFLPLKTTGSMFYERGEQGRSVILRGVNLSGNVKLPVDYATHMDYDWASLRDPANLKAISFVGRPFPLKDAEEHLARLERWGFNCLRFLITWEAVAHAGPFDFDEAYLDYIEEVIRLAGEFGMYVFVDPHQDVWSRATGGSGAPIWTLELAGLDVGALAASNAAFTHHTFSPEDPRAFPRMTWPQNYQRFACLHMFTLFFAGKEYCPAWMVPKTWQPGQATSRATSEQIAAEEAVNIQDFMQNAYFEAMSAVARRVAKFTHVIGFDTFNEPSAGFVGKRLDQLPETIIPPGLVFTPGNAMISAAGLHVQVLRANGIGMLSGPDKIASASVWLEGAIDPWREVGVWKQNGSAGEILQPDHFCKLRNGSPCNWFRDFLVPFAQQFRARIRTIMPRLILFVEGDAFGHDDFFWPSHGNEAENVVNATHWYDGATLFMRRFYRDLTINVRTKMPVIGRSRVRALHAANLSYIVRLPRDPVSAKRVHMPTLLGEFGIPYDLNGEVGLRTGNFTAHDRALSMYYSIFDELMLNSTQWNYTSTNSNKWGDDWNMENLSIFSPDQQFNRGDPDSGARGFLGFCRPYAPLVCGARVSCRFDDTRGVFVLRYFPHPRNFDVGKMDAATVIFIPDVHFSVVLADLPLPAEMDVRSPRVGYKGAVPLSQREMAFKVTMARGTYLMHRLPGRHVLYVWALENSQIFDALEPVEVRVSRTRENGEGDVDCLGACC